MQISSLKLLNFRNYETLELKFSNKVNLIYGKNGMGKTNIIEAIYMLGLTKTFRSNNDDIVIKKGKNIAKIEGTIKDNIFNNYKIIISNAGKRIKIDNNKIAKVSDYITKVNIILFNPDDLKLIKDTPSIRRKMLNIEISGINGEYLLLLNSYNKVLKQRNAYLKALNKKKDYETSFLNILTEQLVDLGLKIMWIREDFINNINSYISDIYYEITHKGTLKVVYKSEFLGKNKEDLLKMFEKNISREIFLGKTIFGIQHDDLEFQVDSEIVKEFSSVGEQKNSIISFKLAEIKNIEEKLQTLESKIGINYNMDQEKAIITALNNNITIISGGPGTGKTTIINAITKLYIEEYRLGPADIMETIALLAPTGRASKKLATSTSLPAYTIHRYLKWYKDSDSFFYNEYNKTSHKLIIVDEVSMIDIDLIDALLKGISPNIKLILVGDINQLPSVGPGLILEDLISSDYFNYVPLNQIYRQSDNSYIPYLAKEIRNRELSEEFLTKKDDYSFIQAPKEQVKEDLEQIIRYSLDKGIDEAKMQILAPMYKGENGIDNLNLILQKIYNPRSANKNEMIYGDVIYREGDKVLQLVNDLDKNVFNGDIGFIKSIDSKEIVIDFEGNKVTYPKKDLKQIKHAYAITIHKSQGSEFEHVIMPVVSSYYKMLYNKLIYTGVSRAKKSLTIIGDPMAFARAVNNNYSQNRKTTLKDKIIEVYNLKV
mgnify:CR=1 FL=1